MANGLPDITTLATLGGAKSDYAPVEDATTDVSAAEHNLITSCISSLSYTGVRAWCRFVTNNTSAPTDPASNVHGAMWGNAGGVKPVVARTGTGVFTITWTATQSDFLAVSHTLALVTGWVNYEGSTTGYGYNVKLTSPNVATVRIFTTSTGTALDTTAETFAVFVL